MTRKAMQIFGGPSLWDLLLAFADPCPLSGDKIDVNAGGLREVSFKVKVGRKYEELSASIFELSDVRHAGSSRDSAPTTLLLRGDLRYHDALDIFDISEEDCDGLDDEVDFIAEYNVHTRRGVINIFLEKK